MDYYINDKIIEFKIRSFICDLLACCFLSQTAGSNSFQGCGKCVQISRRVNNRTVFSITRAEPRTDEDFKRRVYVKFHKIYPDSKLDLEELGIGMVSQIPLDPMHLIDLGVCRKMLNLLLQGKTIQKISVATKNALSNKLISLSPFLPNEFARKPRSLDELCRWKATEFRQFLLYTGIVVLKNVVHDDIYDHFCLLHCAYKLLSTEKSNANIVNVAKNIIDYFVEIFPTIYPEDQLSYNMHSLLHLTECVNDLGCLNTFSSYPFENYLQKLKKMVKKPNHILQQLYNKINFESYFENCEDITIKEKRGIIVSVQTPSFFSVWTLQINIVF